jgi:DNA-binding winged helix-turn-helix (wHTH) protein
MEKKTDEIPIIVAGAGPLNGQRWAVHNKLLIGRDPACDIMIAERQVSRHHARLVTKSEGVYIEDLDSKNGTYRNGHPVEEATLLEDSDMFQIALAQQFTYLSSDATLPLEADDIEFQSLQERKLRLDKRSRRVWVGEKEVLPPLSVSQFSLLEILYDHQGRVVSRSNIIEYVWGEEQALHVSEQALDALIRRLRDRLSEFDPDHAYVVTIRGHGLRMENPPR